MEPYKQERFYPAPPSATEPPSDIKGYPIYDIANVLFERDDTAFSLSEHDFEGAPSRGVDVRGERVIGQFRTTSGFLVFSESDIQEALYVDGQIVYITVLDQAYHPLEEAWLFNSFGDKRCVNGVIVSPPNVCTYRFSARDDMIEILIPNRGWFILTVFDRPRHIFHPAYLFGGRPFPKLYTSYSNKSYFSRHAARLRTTWKWVRVPHPDLLAQRRHDNLSETTKLYLKELDDEWERGRWRRRAKSLLEYLGLAAAGTALAFLADWLGWLK